MSARAGIGRKSTYNAEEERLGKAEQEPVDAVSPDARRLIAGRWKRQDTDAHEKESEKPSRSADDGLCEENGAKGSELAEMR